MTNTSDESHTIVPIQIIEFMPSVDNQKKSVNTLKPIQVLDSYLDTQIQQYKYQNGAMDDTHGSIEDSDLAMIVNGKSEE